MKSKMNQLVNKLNKNASLAATLLLTVALLAATSASAAEDDSAVYVDSVLKWGAWELDIEPAAGGISAPGTKPLNARGTKVALRTNSIAALAPSAPAPGGGAPSNPIVPGTPVPQRPPTQPVNPPIPTPAAPANFAPPGAITTPTGGVTLAPPAPAGPAPTGSVTTTAVTLP